MILAVSGASTARQSQCPSVSGAKPASQKRRCLHMAQMTTGLRRARQRQDLSGIRLRVELEVVVQARADPPVLKPRRLAVPTGAACLA